jgi:DNA-directed RNA polymerase subunit L
MVLVKNIKRNTNTINLSKSKYKSLQKYVPDILHKNISFELVNTNYSLANAIRRVLINELPIKHLTVSLNDIYSDDKYIVDDIIKARLEGIPIPQNIDTSVKYNIKYLNNQETYCNINSSEIKHNGKSISHGIKEIPICNINSQNTLVVSDIIVTTSYGYDNGRCSPGRVSYEIINHDLENNSSINSNPTDFKIGFEVSGVYNPDELIVLGIDELLSRLNRIDFNDFIIEFGVYKLHIIGETHTIGRLISRYIFDILPSIDYCAMRIIHPSKRECVIDVRHPEGEKLVKQAIVNIVKDLTIIKNAFK